MVFPSAVEVVREFWRLMATNDFESVGSVMAPEFVVDWPQSKERIRGAENFARMNQEYPANGPWKFSIQQIIGNETDVVSNVSITDGVQSATAISFFTVNQGKIVRLVEYWPESFAPAANRAHLVESLE